jgi:LPXTG-site transpeptidase (sortase) family protein
LPCAACAGGVSAFSPRLKLAVRLRYAFALIGLVVIAACQSVPATPEATPSATLPTRTAVAPTGASPAPTKTPVALTPVVISQTETPSPTVTPPQPATATPTAIATTPPGLPPHLIIPALDLDREVVTVPVRKGNWDLTGLGQNVGWLETTGQKPGDALAMVFAGHVTVTAVQPGPFADLWKLAIDAPVIYRWGGTDYVYTVKYKLSASPNDVRRLYVEDKQALLLVTCSEWDYTAFDYAKRLIVVAQAASPTPTPDDH